jgi:hypothetical protein
MVSLILAGFVLGIIALLSMKQYARRASSAGDRGHPAQRPVYRASDRRDASAARRGSDQATVWTATGGCEQPGSGDQANDLTLTKNGHFD